MARRDERAVPHRAVALMRWWQTRWFALVAMLLAAVPLLWPAVPPLIDLPGHIGRYRVMLGDEAAVLGQWFEFRWRPVGNLGVDLLVAALGPWLGLETAVKAVVIAIPVLTVGGALWLSRELHGRVSPWALFALPLAYNYPLHFGFVNYALAMALMLPGWALWLRLGPSRLRFALFVAIGLVVWTAHIVGWAMLCLFVFGGEWAVRRSRGDRLIPAALRAGIASLPLAPPALLLFVWRSGGSGGITERWFDLMTKLEGVSIVLRDRWFLLDVASVALLLILIYAAARGRIGRIEPRAAAAAALASIAFLLLPFTLMGSAYADMRLLPYAMLVALAGIAPVASANVQRIALAGLAFFLLRIAANTASLAIYDRDWTRELAALDHVPRGARVLALTGDTCEQPWAHRRISHLPGLAIARRAAFANDQWLLAGAPLLTVKLDGAGFFAQDPSQVVLPAPCPNDPNLLPQKTALAAFPRAPFTHLWLVRPHPFAPGQLSGMTMIWRDGSSMLLEINHKPRLRESRPLE
ncbi:hypothetical protein M9978_04510 [Sphingomonas sp. MG17]|uniref:Uncharacterized protein n=1 Tax=Sphingomonas tagetis TaxID=2949092 RepID=A0A9X2KJP0_9SPHN|nr:hypothetical protein [Sphingomonas tagetis]MCP3729684.1 hypothetical protein [Sphingomonas tagetis]